MTCHLIFNGVNSSWLVLEPSATPPPRNVLKIETSIHEWFQRQVAKAKLKCNQNQMIRQRMKCQRFEKGKENRIWMIGIIHHVISRPLTSTVFLKAVIYTSFDARGYRYLVIEQKTQTNKKQTLQPLFSYRFHSSICRLYGEILIILETESNC